MRDAKCAGIFPRHRGDEDIFFPEKGRSDLSRTARDICSKCPVSAACEDYRLRTDSKFGIWGGKVTSRKKRA